MLTFSVDMLTHAHYCATMLTRHQVKAQLKNRGWTYRSAAVATGRSLRHLAYVLSGERPSRSMLAALYALPDRRGEKQEGGGR
jgi:RecA-family ATPase